MSSRRLPEVSLRDLPRITVRGQTVQGGGGTLRKALLRSSVLPWSTKRHCGPLAFRHATEGSRVLRRVWGSQEGAREPYGALAPFCLRRETPAIPPPPWARRPPRRRFEPRTNLDGTYSRWRNVLDDNCIIQTQRRISLPVFYERVNR